MGAGLVFKLRHGTQISETNISVLSPTLLSSSIPFTSPFHRCSHYLHPDKLRNGPLSSKRDQGVFGLKARTIGMASMKVEVIGH